MYEKSDLQNPIMLVAFGGTFDVADVATSSILHLENRFLAKDVGMVDPELFYNFQKSRPITRMDSSGERVIEWPGIDFKVSTYGAESDLILVVGDEPHFSWEKFADHIVKVANLFACKMVISLGAVAGVVPHTRGFPVVGYSANEEAAKKFELEVPEYEGPTGFMAALNRACDVSSIPSLSFKVEVPHYLPSPPNPKAVQTLLAYVEQILDVGLFSDDLDEEVAEWCDLVDQAVATDDESLAYVEQLENQHDAEDQMAEAGRDLVIELETFLQEGTEDQDEQE